MATIEYYSDLDLGLNEIKNVVVDKVSTIPTGDEAIAGRIIYLTTATTGYPVGFYYHDGTSWKQVATGGDTTAISTQVDYLKSLVGMNDSGQATKANGTVTKDVDDLKTAVGSNTAGSETGIYALIKAKQDTVTAGTGLAFGTGANAATLGHSNSVTAATTAVGGANAALKVKYDAQGHITETSTDAMYPPTTVGTNGQYWGTNGTTPAWKSPATSLTASSTTEIPSSKAVADAISTAVTGAYKVKGSKTAAEINTLTGMVKGDVYNISIGGTITNTGYTSFTVVAGDNIVWTGNSAGDEGWDKLSSTVSISYPVTDVTIDSVTALSGTVAVLKAAAGKDVDTSTLNTTNDTSVPSSKLVGTQLAGKMAKLASAPTTGGALLVTVLNDDDSMAVQSAAVGATNKPIYINSNGVPTAISGTIGGATQPVYIADGVITAGTSIGDAGYLGKTVQGSGTSSVFTSSSDDSKVPTDKAVYTALTKKVDANTAITGATKCKITYDAKGLVLSGADLSASDIPTITSDKLSDFGSAVETRITGHFKEVALNASTGVSVSGSTYTITTASKPYGVMVLHNNKQVFVDTTIGATSIVLTFNSSITASEFKVTYIESVISTS